MPATFLLQFEQEIESTLGEATINMGTGTATRVREEPDQDQYVLGTQTLTEVREEKDQDRGNSALIAVPLE